MPAFVFALAFLFSVGYWVLMPAWPLGATYTKGLLGLDQRNLVTASLQEAALERSVWTKKIETEDYAAIQSDPRLMTIVRETGATVFGNNCAMLLAAETLEMVKERFIESYGVPKFTIGFGCSGGSEQLHPIGDAYPGLDG